MLTKKSFLVYDLLTYYNFYSWNPKKGALIYGNLQADSLLSWIRGQQKLSHVSMSLGAVAVLTNPVFGLIPLHNYTPALTSILGKSHPLPLQLPRGPRSAATRLVRQPGAEVEDCNNCGSRSHPKYWGPHSHGTKNGQWFLVFTTPMWVGSS